MLLPVDRIDEIEGFSLNLGKKHYYFRGGETPFNDSCSASLASDKYCTNKVLELAGIPVPKAIVMHVSTFKKARLEEKIADLKFPLVVKPTINSSRGQDVLCNIQTIEQLKSYLQTSFSCYDYLTIEEFHGNLKSYRVLVFNRQVLGVIQRYPAYVIGDGKHTINELIELTTKQRKKLNDALGPIVVDEECQIRLKELGIALDYIPQQDEQVFLGYTSNASRGGSFESQGKQICKENSQLMIRVATLLNLNLVGIDVECTDINLPIETSQGVIIEANYRPSIKIHENPMSGIPTRVSKKILRSLIYRHPFSYLYVLYTNRRTVFYTRSIVLIIFFGLMYKLVV